MAAWWAQWRQPPLQLRPAQQGSELPLRPSPRLRQALWTGAGLLGLHVAELALRGHRAVAALLLVVAMLAVLRARAAPGHDPARPRRLLLTADGRFHLITVGGGIEPVQLLPASLRVGRHLLLVLRGTHRTHRLFLGSDNLEPATLAALGRRLGQTRLIPGTALDSTPPDRGRPESR